MDGPNDELDTAKERFCKLGIKLKKLHRMQYRKTKMKSMKIKSKETEQTEMI